MLLLSGIILHIMICALLMRPPSYFEKHVTAEPEATIDTKSKADVIAKSLTQNGITNGIVKNGNSTSHKAFSSLQNVDITLEVESPLLKHLTPTSRRSQLAMVGRSRARTISERSKTNLVQRMESSLSVVSMSNIGGFASTELSISLSSMANLAGSINKLNQAHREIKTQQLEKECYQSDEKCYKNIARKVNCSAFNFGILKRPPFLLFLVCACLIVTISSIQMFLPPFAIDSGISSKDSDFLITVISIVEIFGTVTWGYIADKQIIKRHKIITLAACSVAVVSFSAPFFRSYGVFIAYSVWYGFFGRVYFGLFPVVLVDFLGIENLGAALGLLMVLQTAFNAIMQPVVGGFVDRAI